MNKKVCITHEVQAYIFDTNNNNNEYLCNGNGRMEDNISMWPEFRKSGWKFRRLPLQASTCSQYVG